MGVREPGRYECYLGGELCFLYNSKTSRLWSLFPRRPDSLHASSYPTSHSTFSWGSSYHSPKATHRMWSAMDLPLLRNIYSVLFAKYESELLTMVLTRGWDCGGGSPPSVLPGTPP